MLARLTLRPASRALTLRPPQIASFSHSSSVCSHPTAANPQSTFQKRLLHEARGTIAHRTLRAEKHKALGWHHVPIPEQLTWNDVETRTLKAIRNWDRFPSEKAEQLKLEASFTDMGFDSLDKVEIMMCIEEEFELSIPVEVGDEWKTVQDIVKHVGEIEGVYE